MLEVQLQAAGIPPIIVHLVVLERMFHQEEDLLLSIMTFLWETRGLRQDSAKSIKNAQDSTQRSLRAYVTVDQIIPRNQTSQGVPKEVDITVINTGQTPARHLEVLQCVWLLEEIPTSFAELTDKFRTWMPADVGKDQRRTVHGHFIGRDELLSTVVDNSNRVVVCGVVRYQDVVSEQEEKRRTEFCFVWDHRLQGFYPAGPMNTIT